MQKLTIITIVYNNVRDIEVPSVLPAAYQGVLPDVETLKKLMD